MNYRFKEFSVGISLVPRQSNAYLNSMYNLTQRCHFKINPQFKPSSDNRRNIRWKCPSTHPLSIKQSKQLPCSSYTINYGRWKGWKLRVKNPARGQRRGGEGGGGGLGLQSGRRNRIWLRDTGCCARCERRCEGYDDGAHPSRQLPEKERDRSFGVLKRSEGTNKTLLES